MKTKGLPEVQAIKFIDLSNKMEMKCAWETEVKDANLYLEGKIVPNIE